MLLSMKAGANEQEEADWPKMTRQERLSHAARVETAREARGWTQQELADRAGVSRGSVGNIERAKTAPQAEKLWRVMVALDLSPDPLAGIPEAARKWVAIIAPLIAALPDERREDVMMSVLMTLGRETRGSVD